jgi:hypothetical protein
VTSSAAAPGTVRATVHRLVPQILCVAVVPMALSTVTMRLAGLAATAAVTLIWTYSASAWHRVRHGVIPGLLVLRIVTDTLKVAATIVTGSATVFFLQPSASTLGVALLCLGSVVVGRPIGDRIARDYLPAEALSGRTDGPVLAQITLWWGAMKAASALGGVLVFTHTSLETFLVLRPFVGWTASGLGAAGTAWLWARSRPGAVVLPLPTLPAPAVLPMPALPVLAA